jgi:GMP synthase-like glutamine amidotransferase
MEKSPLWIIDPSIVRPEVEACERLVHMAASRGITAQVVRPAFDGPASLANPSLCGAIVLGSAASVNEPSAWRDALVELLRPIIRGTLDRPLLGICYGHQLIAWISGARVGWARSDRSKLVGVRDIALTRTCELFSPGQHDLCVGVSHFEAVLDLPSGFVQTARHDECELHGLMIPGRKVFTLQSHPELSDEALQRLGWDGPTPERRLYDGRTLLERFVALTAQGTKADSHGTAECS